MGIKVHGVAASRATARVLLCLCEKDLPNEFVPIDLAFGLHKQQSRLSLNVTIWPGTTLEDSDITLFESRAINRYLARKYKNIGVDLLGSNSFKESASVETWLEVEAHQFNAPISSIINQTIESEMHKLGKVLDVYEERLSKHKYLIGDNYSLADLHHIRSLPRTLHEKSKS